MDRSFARAAAPFLAAALALTGCGSMSQVQGVRSGDGGATAADGGPGADGGPFGALDAGAGGPDGGTGGDAGVVQDNSLTFFDAAPACSPSGGPAFELTLAPKPISCGSRHKGAGMNHVVLDLWSFPTGPETIRFGPDQKTAQGIWCHFPTGTLTCFTATRGTVVLADWPGNPGPTGTYHLSFASGPDLQGNFKNAKWCMRPVRCQ